jgi:thioredoxin 1
LRSALHHDENFSMSADTPAVLELTEQNFASSINDHPFAVIDFWAPWCAPCRAFAPTFAAAAAKRPDVLFAKVNTEEQQVLAAHFNIRSIPTLMIFRDNIIVFAESGALPASALDQVLDAARDLDMEAVRREVAARNEPAVAASAGAAPAQPTTSADSG